MTVHVDGVARTLEPWEKLRLGPGESVTVDRGVYHRFYGEAGKGVVLVGEVSQVNDDRTDNYFLDPVGRFAEIEEDEPPLRLLWNEVAAEGAGRSDLQPSPDVASQATVRAGVCNRS